MHALNEPEPDPLEPLALLPELDGLLPHAVRARATTATPESTAPVRFICTDFSLSRSGPAPATGAAFRVMRRSGDRCGSSAGPQRSGWPRSARSGRVAGGALLIADPRDRALRCANVSRSL